jgi:hypothetical protein
VRPPQLLRLGACATSVLVACLGCATLQQFAALGKVDFSLDRIANPRLAGVDLSRINSYDDIGFAEASALALAAAQKRLPLEFELHVLAQNPADNDVQARLLRMDWTLLLENRETLSGVLEEEVLLPPGQPRDIPIVVGLNLVDFFEGSARDLIELALSFTGQGGEPKEVALRASPVIDTAIGPIRYPQPITILRREVGGVPGHDWDLAGDRDRGRW